MDDNEALPKLDYTLFEDELPSNGKKIKYRSMLLKEEKILLIAKQANDLQSMFNAVKQVVKNCIITPQNFDVEKIAEFDLEYIYLRIYSKSINNIVHQRYKDNEDGQIYDFDINLDEVKVIKTEDHSTRIRLTDTVGIVMRYPEVGLVKKLSEETITDISDLTIKLLKSCIDKVYTKDKVLDFTKYPVEDQDKFLDVMPLPSAKRIKKFFDDAPHMEYKITYKNKNNNEREIVLRNLEDFFTLR